MEDFLLSSGDRINKYQILGEIAQGGEAIVYRALDTFEQKEVALKVIHEKNVRLEPEISKLFLREGKILSEINDPSIIKIYESNIAQVNGKEYFYHAMELVDAPTLEEWLKQNKPGWKETVRILRAIAVAVDILHNREDPILHRDLKPSNIFLLDPGLDKAPAIVKIFDFGLAKSEFEQTLTKADEFRGTLRYAGPERIKRFSNTSTASDIYSLGIILEDLLGEEVHSDIARWVLDLKKLMCDPVPLNRPSVNEVIQIIDEQLEARSRITIALTKLMTLKSRIRMRKWRHAIRALGVVIIIIVIALLGYMTYIYIKPGLKLVGSIKTETPFAVAVSGKYAYVVEGKFGLNVIDVDNPKHARIVSSLKTEDNAQGIAIQGNYACIADGLAGVRIIDISDPQTPSIIGGVKTTNAYDIALSGNYVYVADEAGGLKILDVSNPTNPAIIGSFDTPNYTYSVVADNNHAYLADSDYFIVLDIRDPRNPKQVGSLKTKWERDMALRDHYVYVADSESGLAIIDISDPSNPKQVGGHKTIGPAIGLALSGRYAYVANDKGGLVVVDVSDPTKPKPYDGSFLTRTPALGVTVDNRYIYLLASGEGLKILRLK